MIFSRMLGPIEKIRTSCSDCSCEGIRLSIALEPHVGQIEDGRRDPVSVFMHIYIDPIKGNQ